MYSGHNQTASAYVTDGGLECHQINSVVPDLKATEKMTEPEAVAMSR
jgi:hypothetical protein